MHKIIITADDYGMSKAVNRAIDEGITAGLITSTNVMTNMPYCDEAKKYLTQDKVSIGIHWTLSCGSPVCPASEIPSLVDENGHFYKYPQFRSRYRKNKISHDDIRKELYAQYNKYVTVMGKQPDYWNTHQNVHVDFVIYRLFVSVATELNINRMRSHQRVYVPCSINEDKQPLSWRIVEPLKSRMINCWQEKAHRRGIKSPDGLIVCLNNMDINRLDYVFQNILWGNNEVAEYVIHPATENDSPFFGKIVEQRVREYNLFTSQDTLASIKKNGIELVNYSCCKG